MTSVTMDQLRRALEDALHRPVIDETDLTGFYDFKLKGQARTTEEFLAMLRDQSGLLVSPARRSVEMTVVRPVN